MYIVFLLKNTDFHSQSRRNKIKLQNIFQVALFITPVYSQFGKTITVMYYCVYQEGSLGTIHRQLVLSAHQCKSP